MIFLFLCNFPGNSTVAGEIVNKLRKPYYKPLALHQRQVDRLRPALSNRCLHLEGGAGYWRGRVEAGITSLRGDQGCRPRSSSLVRRIPVQPGRLSRAAAPAQRSSAVIPGRTYSCLFSYLLLFLVTFRRMITRSLCCRSGVPIAFCNQLRYNCHCHHQIIKWAGKVWHSAS